LAVFIWIIHTYSMLGVFELLPLPLLLALALALPLPLPLALALALALTPLQYCPL
jgi:hypothetical protein